jgi:hypothetical protein
LLARLIKLATVIGVLSGKRVRLIVPLLVSILADMFKSVSLVNLLRILCSDSDA